MIDIEEELRELLDLAGVCYDGAELARLARPIQQHIEQEAAE